MNSIDAVQAVVDQFVVVVRFVEDDFCFDTTSRRLELGVMLYQFTNDAAIFVKFSIRRSTPFPDQTTVSEVAKLPRGDSGIIEELGERDISDTV